MWAGFISLDFTACGAVLWFRNRSSAVRCFGWLLGQVAVGIIIGGIVQLLWMDLSPVGVGIPYDATATTLLAVYWSTRLGGGGVILRSCWLWLWPFPLGFFFRWVDQLARPRQHPAHA